MRRQAKKFAVGGVDGLTWHQATTIPTQFFELFPRQRNFGFFPATAGCLSNCWEPLSLVSRIFFFIVKTRPQKYLIWGQRKKYFWYEATKIPLNKRPPLNSFTSDSWSSRAVTKQREATKEKYFGETKIVGGNIVEIWNVAIAVSTGRQEGTRNILRNLKNPYTQMKKLLLPELENHFCIFKGGRLPGQQAAQIIWNFLKED